MEPSEILEQARRKARRTFLGGMEVTRSFLSFGKSPPEKNAISSVIDSL